MGLKVSQGEATQPPSSTLEPSSKTKERDYIQKPSASIDQIFWSTHLHHPEWWMNRQNYEAFDIKGNSLGHLTIIPRGTRELPGWIPHHAPITSGALYRWRWTEQPSRDDFTSNLTESVFLQSFCGPTVTYGPPGSVSSSRDWTTATGPGRICIQEHLRGAQERDMQLCKHMGETYKAPPPGRDYSLEWVTQPQIIRPASSYPAGTNQGPGKIPVKVKIQRALGTSRLWRL